MTDHKTVREAIIELRGYIHRAPAHYNAPYHNDVMRISEQALAALDRIEATQPPQATDAQRREDIDVLMGYMVECSDKEGRNGFRNQIAALLGGKEG